jgi:CRISPR system Cascade subunit CasE
LQSRTIPSWTEIGVKGWLAKADPAIDLEDRLKLDSLKVGQRFRFRLRANPCVTRNGKRLGLLRLEDQENWIERKEKLHGFSLPKLVPFDLSGLTQKRVDIRISQEQMLRGNQHSGNAIRIFSVLYDGILTVTEPDRFRDALQTGVGHGKAMGLGLLSVAPIDQAG